MPVWVYILVYLFEGFTAYLFFSEISLRRHPLPACIAVGLLTFGLAMVQNVAMGNSNVFWNVIFSALAVFLFALFSFSMKPLHILAYSAILTALNLAAELIVVFATSSLADASTEALYARSYLFALDTLGSKLLYFLACYVLSRLAAPSNQRTRVPVSLFLYPAALLGCLLGFWYICAEPTTSDRARQVLTLLSVVLFLATVTLFLAFQHEIRRDSELLSIRQEYERQKMEQEYYGILEQQNQHLMIYAHDAKNHLAAIQALNTDPQIDAYVAALSGDLTAYAQGLHSGNKMLDVILEKYLRSCRQKGIDFHFEVRACNLAQVAPTDLVTILGNLLDNALTAAEASRRKTITLDTACRNHYSVLVLSNSCDAPPRSNGRQLLSTKSDARLHGYGLKSVASALSRYAGDYSWDYDPTAATFTVTIMLHDAES